MIRILAFVALVALAIFAAVSVAERPGAVSLTWHGWRIDTTAAFLLLVTAVVAAVASLAYRLWLALRRAPQALRNSRRGSRRQRGYEALTQGMVAVAAGDAEEALRQARRADSLLGDPPLTMLLSAQAAQLGGDEAAARSYFTAMLDRRETAFLGLRGLLMQAERDGDREAALKLARRAFELRPKTPWVLTTLFDLEIKRRRWREALALLEQAVRHHAFSAAEARSRRAVVLLGCSGEAEAEGTITEALAYARRAHRLVPAFLPATLRLLSLMAKSDKTRPATRIIHNAWERRPHPELARIYGALERAADPLKRFGRFERLFECNPGDRESHIAVAEAALAAKLWGTARNHLERAAGDDAPARVCRMMAELEEAEHGDGGAAREWLLRAASAGPEAAWLCTGCGAAAGEWTPLCTRCEALGTLEWGTPDRLPKAALGPPAAAGPPAGVGRAIASDQGAKGATAPAPVPAPGAVDAIPDRR